MTTAEFHIKNRPTKFSDVIGQPAAVSTLTSFVQARKVPHCMLFTGPSGCGKTTLARILRREIGCGDHDFTEINGSSTRGVDMIREIESVVGLAPMSGRARVWLIDEVHQLTKEAQSAALKLFEDVPRHVYFFLATTDPQKLLPTIRTRATEIALRSLSFQELETVVQNIAELNDKLLDEKVIAAIANAADGSARSAVKILNQIVYMGTVDEQLAGVNEASKVTQGDEIARLIFRRATWNELRVALERLADNQEAETVRRIVLGWARKRLLQDGPNSNGGRFAMFVIEEFARNYFDTGMAGLAYSCAALFAEKN